MLVKDIPVICTYNISDVERRYRDSGNFVKGLMGSKGIKTLLGQDLNWFTCASVCTVVDWQKVGGF